MKRPIRSLTALCLAALLLCQAAPAAFASAALGSAVTEDETGLAPGATLTTNRFWSDTYQDLRTEHYITCSLGSGLSPVVSFGATVIAKNTLPELEAGLRGAGMRIIGGVNGGFYTVATGTPVGIVIREGELCSSASEGQYAVGFRADGTALVGQPAVTVTAAFHGETLKVAGGLNKTRTETGGIFLLSDVYAANTQNTAPGVDVILTPENGARPTLGNSIRCTVDEVRASESSNTLPAGKLVLTMNAAGDPETLAKLWSLLPGEEVALDFSCSDSAWNDVTNAVGSLYSLLSGGAVTEGLPTGAAPRTAIGVKADGSVVLYTVDGRQSGYSVGASYTQVAQRLAELGCVDAVALDGGGSTTLGAALPGGGFSVLNRPSDGYARSISNGVLIAFAVQEPTGVLSHFELGPGGAVVLKGASLPLTATAVDTAYTVMPAPVPLTYAATGLGTVDGEGTYTALSAGTDTVTVTGGGASGSVSIVNVETPDTICVVRESTTAPLTAITVEPGGTVDLSAVSTWKGVELVDRDECYTWSVDSTVGTVDETGVLTVGTLKAEGDLTVSAGGTSTTLRVTVDGLPFTDVEMGIWYYDAVRHAYSAGLFSGMTADTFAPDLPMSRAMLVTVLWRRSGCPEAEPAEGEEQVTFTDVPEGAYYTRAVAWAAQKGVVSGVGGGLFRPDDPVTRQQIAVMLRNYAVLAEGKDLTLPEGALTTEGFSDRDRIAPWAAEAVEWAVGAGLLQGSGGALSPEQDASRCQVAAVLMRYDALN